MVILFLSCSNGYTLDPEEEANQLPEIIIISPQNGSEYVPGNKVNISVNADDKDGSIKKILIYINDALTGEINTLPYTYEWSTNNIIPGDYEIYAKAVDNLGGETETEKIKVKFSPELELRFINIPSGTFGMGSDDNDASEKPFHAVTLTNDFLLSKYEVTNSQYKDMLNYALENDDIIIFPASSTVKNFEGTREILISYGENIIYEDSKFSVIEGKENHPVTNVTWYGAAFFCNIRSRMDNIEKLYDQATWQSRVYPDSTGYRLPTEAEWEYSARYDVEKQKYPWGSEEPDETRANYARINGENSTSYAGKYSPLGDTKPGAGDMAGNAMEWVNDWYISYSNTVHTDPEGPDAGNKKVLRGGSWKTGSPTLRCSYRHIDTPSSTSDSYGFRVIKYSHE